MVNHKPWRLFRKGRMPAIYNHPECRAVSRGTEVSLEEFSSAVLVPGRATLSSSRSCRASTVPPQATSYSFFKSIFLSCGRFLSRYLSKMLMPQLEQSRVLFSVELSILRPVFPFARPDVHQSAERGLTPAAYAPTKSGLISLHLLTWFH